MKAEQVQQQELMPLEGRHLNLKELALKNVLPQAAVLFRFLNPEEYHLIVVGTDENQNKILCRAYHANEQARISSNYHTSFIVETAGRSFDNKEFQKEIINALLSFEGPREVMATSWW